MGVRVGTSGVTVGVGLATPVVLVAVGEGGTGVLVAVGMATVEVGVGVKPRHLRARRSRRNQGSRKQHGTHKP